MAIEKEELYHRSAIDDHHRKEDFKKLLNCIIKKYVILISFAGLVAVSFLFWHMLLPVSEHFLSDKQLETINTIIFSSFVTVAIGAWFQKNI